MNGNGHKFGAIFTDHAVPREAQQVGENAGGGHFRPGARTLHDQRIRRVAVRFELHDIVGEVDVAERMVFVDSLEQSAWGPDQQVALEEIAASKDPRLAWIVSDMMRFTWRASFDDALAEAASRLQGGLV